MSSPSFFHASFKYFLRLSNFASNTTSVSSSCGINPLILFASCSDTAAPEIACVRKVVVLSISATSLEYSYPFFDPVNLPIWPLTLSGSKPKPAIPPTGLFNP